MIELNRIIHNCPKFIDYPCSVFVSLFILIMMFCLKYMFRFVNFSWRLLRIVNMDGFGVVQMVLPVSTDMLYHLDLSLKRYVLLFRFNEEKF